MLEQYMDVGQKRLRCGYTTGTCAAAAARGAAEALLTGQFPPVVTVPTPAGVDVTVELLEQRKGSGFALCAVEKDGGDDPDVTNGALIFARVEQSETGGIAIDGGEGVGRVTLPGLDQPVGNAAINSVPRRMIEREVSAAAAAAGYTGGLAVTIFVPKGTEIAQKTFNPRLGIVGGISILGTGGIVRPMSEAALIATTAAELNSLYARGVRHVLVSPGNYGEDFSRDVLHLSMDRQVLCSNYIGDAIDKAASLGFESFLLVGHLGKLIKIAGGAMNTHSKTADGRRETLVCHAALCGADGETLKRLYDAPTTDAAIPILEAAHLREAVLASIATALKERLTHRAGDMTIAAIFFSSRYGILGKTAGADSLLPLHQGKEETI